MTSPAASEISPAIVGNGPPERPFPSRRPAARRGLTVSKSTSRTSRLDTECGIGIDATGRDDVQAALRRLRRRLLSEHLGVDPDEFATSEERVRLLGAVAELSGGERTLKRLETDEPELGVMLEPVARLADPDRPLDLGNLIDDVL